MRVHELLASDAGLPAPASFFRSAFFIMIASKSAVARSSNDLGRLPCAMPSSLLAMEA